MDRTGDQSCFGEENMSKKPHEARTAPRICERCNVGFLALPHQVKIGRARWCSMSCYDAERNKANKIAPDFWAKVDASGGPDSCWPWLGCVTDLGYGQVRHEGRTQSAHRVAYRMSGHPLGAHEKLRHSCDNPPCCNPRHHLPGTQKDNVNDSIARGRWPRGDKWYTSRGRQVPEKRV
jgi:hypothetical protein